MESEVIGVGVVGLLQNLFGRAATLCQQLSAVRAEDTGGRRLADCAWSCWPSEEEGVFKCKLRRCSCYLASARCSCVLATLTPGKTLDGAPLQTMLLVEGGRTVAWPPSTGGAQSKVRGDYTLPSSSSWTGGSRRRGFPRYRSGAIAQWPPMSRFPVFLSYLPNVRSVGRTGFRNPETT